MSSPFTSSTYERSIATIKKGLNFQEPDNDFLVLTDAVIDWIDNSKYAVNTKKTFYIAIVSTLKKNPNAPNLIALEKYRAKMDALNKQVQDTMEEQKLSPAEELKYMEWPQILEVYEKIRLAVHDLWSFQDYLIVSLYVLQRPMRLDYADMKVCTIPPKNPTSNYLVWPLGNAKPYFVFSEYKTVKKWGVSQSPPLPQELCDIIRTWLTLVDDEYLLIGGNDDGLPMKAAELGQRIIRIFEKHSGKSVGVNILRHSYESFRRKGEMSFKESAELARQMGHSQTMSQLYRRLT